MENNFDEVLNTFSQLFSKNIEWMLCSFNPKPPEFYRHLNHKTKSVTTSTYSSAHKMLTFQEIREKWKNGVFNKDWNVCCRKISFNIRNGIHEKKISASAFYEESKIVTFEDKSKESESGQKSEVTSRDKFKDSEKDGQKVEVTFEDEFKGSKKDDQATFEDGFRLKKSELNFNISVRLQMDSKKLRNYDKVYRKSTYGLEVIFVFKTCSMYFNP
ncbi:hypothetical protein RhiirA4_505134 [Rhizophagus irregularis]|uniref:Uncharacterized protein n=1 Tax=Rhizophagus irregularis TaxID=588596 RepID=A0A2I1G6W6_9GLOM|nr:hypothetical protein RhiirA4_505134 [Rhizophagus irregularis]